jgi:hypothetical protein
VTGIHAQKAQYLRLEAPVSIGVLRLENDGRAVDQVICVFPMSQSPKDKTRRDRQTQPDANGIEPQLLSDCLPPRLQVPLRRRASFDHVPASASAQHQRRNALLTFALMKSRPT